MWGSRFPVRRYDSLDHRFFCLLHTSFFVMANHRKVCQAVGCVTKAQNGYRGYCKACLRKKFPKLYVEKQKKRRIQDKKNRKMKQKKRGIQAGGSCSQVNFKREGQQLVSIQLNFKKEGQRLARYHKVWQGVKNSKKVLYHKTGSFPAYVRHRETETTGSMSSLSDEQITRRLVRWRKCKRKVHTAIAKAAEKERSAAPAPVDLRGRVGGGVGHVQEVFSPITGKVEKLSPFMGRVFHKQKTGCCGVSYWDDYAKEWFSESIFDKCSS